MTELVITTSPNVTYDVLDVSGSSVKELVKAISNDVWKKVHAAVAKSDNKLAHAFVEVYVDGAMDDELSGELTTALDTRMRPKPKPLPKAKPKPKTEPAAEPAKKASTPRSQSVSAQVKAIVAEHTDKSREELLPIVREKVDAPDPRLKSCIKHWLERL